MGKSDRYGSFHRFLDDIEKRIGSGSKGVGCDNCRDWQEPPYCYEVALASLAPSRPTRAEWEREQATSTSQLPSYQVLQESLTGRCRRCGRRLPEDIVIRQYDYYEGLGIDVENVEQHPVMVEDESEDTDETIDE
jgi:hypothetical protein